MTNNTKYNPQIPEKIQENTINDTIIPVVTNYEDGDVVFEGYGKHELTEIGIGGEYYVVFDAVNEVINRFVIYEKFGSDFIIGWLY